MDEIDIGMIVGIILGLCIMGIVWLVVSSDNTYLKISQETGDEMCQNLVGNETAIAKDYWDYSAKVFTSGSLYYRGKKLIEKGGIVCELPSFDATHNIVIRTND